MKRVFLILLCEEEKLLAHHWSSGCLAYIQSRSCVSVTMASRFEIVDEEYIEEVKDEPK